MRWRLLMPAHFERSIDAQMLRDSSRSSVRLTESLMRNEASHFREGLTWLETGGLVQRMTDSDGTVTRGRDAVARMYDARFPRLRPIRAGGIVQDGLTVLAPTRIAEWGHGWLDLEPGREGAPPVRSGGSYVTIWERQADGHWRIVRNMAF